MNNETSGPVLRPLPAGGGGGFNSTFFHNHRRSASSRVNISSSPMSHSVRFSLGHRSIAVSNRNSPVSQPCMCSPTNHPGSFRCSQHKNGGSSRHHQTLSAYSSRRLNMRRSAMTNSLVRIGGVEGDLVNRALTALIRPSSHQQRRRANFQSRPSRLSAMSENHN